MVHAAATRDVNPAGLTPQPGRAARRDDTIRPLVDFGYLSATTGDHKTVRAAHQIYEHLIGLWATAVIETAYELGVFTQLAANAAMSADEMVTALDTDPRATRVLLNGLLAYGVVARTPAGGNPAGDEAPRYAMSGEFGQALLPGGLYSVAGKIAHDQHVAWQAWGHLGDAVRNGTRDASGNDRTNQISETNYEDLAGGINFWVPPIVDVLAAALTEASWKAGEPVWVLDIGCGTGLYSQLLLDRFPHWSAEGIDAPRIVRIASEQAQRLGVGDRFTGRACDFWQDSWGEAADLILFANIVHLQPGDSVEKLLRNAADVLSPDGLICIADQIVIDEANPTTPQDRFAMLFSASMLATGGGDTYSLHTYDQWLSDAGLVRLAVLDAPMHRLVIAGHAGRTGPLRADAVARTIQ